MVVAFYSPKCHSCRLLESELSQIVAILTSKGLEIDVAKADVSQSRALGDRYQLQKLPTLMFFVADGIVKYQGFSFHFFRDSMTNLPLFLGPHKAAEISKWLEKVCASPGAFIG